MALRDILGHEQILEELRSAWQRGRVAHAYLFSGADGIGKVRTALAFFQLLACKEPLPDPPDACGRCRPCRLFADGRHPDFVRLDPDGRSIKIDQIREVNRVVRFPPVEARTRAVLIPEADLMTEPGANSLLKTLEEPNARNVFVLTTAKPNALLATIRSRCQQLRFSVLSRELVSAWLRGEHGLDADTADEVAAMSEGSLGMAARLVDPTASALREEWLGVLGALARYTPTELLDRAEVFGQSRDDVPQVLDVLRLGLRDVLLRAGGVPADGLTFRRRSGPLPDLGRESALAALECIDEAEDAHGRNVNARMIGERLLLGLRRALRGQ